MLGICYQEGNHFTRIFIDDANNVLLGYAGVSLLYAGPSTKLALFGNEEKHINALEFTPSFREHFLFQIIYDERLRMAEEKKQEEPEGVLYLD